MVHSLPQYVPKRHIILVCIAALLVRGLVFHYFIDPYYRYNQPDTKDYHSCALSLAQGHGLSYYNTDRPIFWRTPGYPLLLVPFYKLFGINGIHLKNYKAAHRTFLWLQILLASLLPAIIFIIANLLVQSTMIAWIASLISTIHLGFVLSSTYLMTDALATLLFLVFIYFLFTALSLLSTHQQNHTPALKHLVGAGLSLGIFTWMRPMGVYLGLAALILLLISTKNKRLLTTLLFSLVFFGSLAPWVVRNYQLTGSVFFCPLWGPYVLTFLVPKIYQRIHGGPLVPIINHFLHQARAAHEKDLVQKTVTHSPYVSCKELICAQIANPWIWAYPGYFMLDWTIEVLKTTCDLYAGHLVNFVRNDFMREPPVEFLTDKLQDCLYRETLPPTIRLISWIEALFHMLILLGLLGGLIFFIARPLLARRTLLPEEKKRLARWMKLGIFIALVIGMTGGFGYARLRLPVEALMIILALDFWLWLIQNYTKIPVSTFERPLITASFLQNRPLKVD